MPEQFASVVADESTTAPEPATAMRRWLDRIFRSHRSRTPVPFSREADVANPLLAFGTERAPIAAFPAKRPSDESAWRRLRVPQLLAVAASVVALVSITALAFMLIRARAATGSSTPSGKLTLDTRPSGAEVVIDGTARGTTPLTVSLPAGAHQVTILRGSDARNIPVNILAGADVTQYLEYVAAEPVVVTGGKISIVTDPPGARVVVDGRLRGTSPLTVSDLSPTDHKVAVSSETGSAERIVSVDRYAATSVVFSLPRVATPIAGWVTLVAPFDVQVSEGGSVVATGQSTKTMLTAGNHTLTLSNDTLQYHDVRQVQVAAGKTTALRIDAPKAAISANARPWADVIIDGTNVGQTPISNLLLTIGEHRVIFRHPQFGERQQTIVVTLKGANRVAVDMSK